MTAPAAAPRVIDVLRNEIIDLKGKYDFKKGLENNLVGPEGVLYTVKPVCKDQEGKWRLAPGYAKGLFACNHCGPGFRGPGGNYWEYTRSSGSIVLNDADLHEIIEHPGQVSQEKTIRIYNFFHQAAKLT